MCCIFTCCGWMIDLIQRAWVFFMSCCIATAVCCVFLVTSMSGVALGYNYSLAEYIELKETNVSVYLKRGIFDDEIVNENDWRRRGRGMPVDGFRADGDVLTAPPDEPEQVPDARRRLEDTIIRSDENNKFEGNLMKLTASAVYETTVTEAVKSDDEMEQILNKYPSGSVDQLKAIQALINERKYKALRDPNVKRLSKSGYDEPILGQLPPEANYRRMLLNPGEQAFPADKFAQVGKDIDRFAAARKAVPEPHIGAKDNWMFPKLTSPDEVYKFTYPKPIYMNLGPIRPTQTTVMKIFPTPTKAVKKMDGEESGLESKEDVGDRFGKRLEHEMVKSDSGGWKKSEIDYYDEDIKGLPVRKRRSINTIINNITKGTDQKTKSSEGYNNNNARPNEITQDINNFVGKLLSSNNPLSNEVTFI